MKVLITGASSGIGKSISELLVNKGHIVCGVGQRAKVSLSLNKERKSNFFYERCDVSSLQEVSKLKKRLDKKGFNPDTVILSAGIYPDDVHPTFDANLFRKTFETNLFGSMNFVSAYLSEFLVRGQGHFIALSSIAAFRPNMRGVAYPSSKAALSLAFRGMDMRYQNKKVFFSTVYLGPVGTEMWEGKKSLLVAKPKDVAKKVVKIMKSKKQVYYFPLFSTFLARVSMIIPDRIYVHLTKFFLK